MSEKNNYSEKEKLLSQLKANKIIYDEYYSKVDSIKDEIRKIEAKEYAEKIRGAVGKFFKKFADPELNRYKYIFVYELNSTDGCLVKNGKGECVAPQIRSVEVVYYNYPLGLEFFREIKFSFFTQLNYEEITKEEFMRIYLLTKSDIDNATNLLNL